MLALIVFFVGFLFSLLTTGRSFSIEKRGLPGIWKVKFSEDACLPFNQHTDKYSIRSELYGQVETSKDQRSIPKEEKKEEILIKLNEDGTFRQCCEGYREGSWMSGRWERRGRNKILFAVDRQYYGPRYDILLEGEFNMQIADEESETLNEKGQIGGARTVNGIVTTGKFMYPKNHPSFFEQPLVSSNSTGTFSMEQAVATFSVLPTPESDATINIEEGENKGDATAEVKFEPSDFYDRKFILTIEPIKLARRSNKATDEEEMLLNQPVDFRAMPIHFHRNNTFQAFGMNKILRGRFGVQEMKHKYDKEDAVPKKNQLWFQVSLFGAGRSAPGSVFSDGNGLTHEDKRSYSGEIMKNDNRLYVSGSVMFGSDLGSDARMEPVAKFLLTEIKDDLQLEEDGDDFDSVFE